MATVLLNGTTYDSADFLSDGGYGYKDATVGFFAVLTAMVAELAAAALVQSVSPGDPGDVLMTVDGINWTSGQGVSPSLLEVIM